MHRVGYSSVAAVGDGAAERLRSLSALKHRSPCHAVVSTFTHDTKHARRPVEVVGVRHAHHCVRVPQVTHSREAAVRVTVGLPGWEAHLRCICRLRRELLHRAQAPRAQKKRTDTHAHTDADKQRHKHNDKQTHANTHGLTEWVRVALQTCPTIFHGWKRSL